MNKLSLAITTLIFTLSAVAAPVELTMPQGAIIGATADGNPEIKVFKGIPYAVPPVGDRRWTYAEAAANWEGQRLAQQFGPNCMQQSYAQDSFFYRPAFPTSEDCLYLNVWTGAKKIDEKRPVMVWIHGGALTRGGGSTATYDGAALAKKGVVLVTINYRLGIFGYFAHPELSKENPNGVSGNYATTDQVQALKWVQDNIAAFGGDPDNVTIFGESAGSWGVNHLVATPLAKNLFHRAIGQSGAVMGAMTNLQFEQGGLASAHSDGEQFAKAVGAKSITGLRNLNAQQLLDLSNEQRWRTAAIVDGWVIPEQINRMFSEGKQNSVTTMLGFNSDEGTTLGASARIPKSVEAYEQTTRARYGSLASEYLRLYPSTDLERSTLDAFRDGFVTWSMQTWAMHMAKVNQPVYFYYFTHRPSGPQQKQLGAYHAAEIRYAFNNVPESPAYEKRMGEIMSNYWVNFASTGDPNEGLTSKGQVQWQTYTADNRRYVELNSETKPGAMAEKDLLPGIWEFYQKVNARSPE